MKRRNLLVLLFVVLFLIALLCSCEEQPELDMSYDGGPLTGKMVAEMFLVKGGVVYVAADGSVYYEDERGKQEIYGTAEEEEITFEEYMETREAETPYDELLGVGEDEYLSDYITEDGYIVGKISGKSETPRAAEEDVIRCRDPQGNSFELTFGGPDGFIRAGELYYLRFGKIYKVPLIPDGTEECLEACGTKNRVMARAGEGIVYLKERWDDKHAFWLLKEDGTTVQLTEYEPLPGGTNRHLVSDGESYAFYSTHDTEVIFGTLLD